MKLKNPITWFKTYAENKAALRWKEYLTPLIPPEFKGDWVDCSPNAIPRILSELIREKNNKIREIESCNDIKNLWL